MSWADPWTAFLGVHLPYGALSVPQDGCHHVTVCEKRRMKDTSCRNVCLSDSYLSCNRNKGLDFPVLTGVQLLSSKFGAGSVLSDLASTVACLPFPFPRLWSSCLNAHFAPLEREPFDDHCFPVTCVFHQCDWDSVFHPAFVFQ